MYLTGLVHRDHLFEIAMRWFGDNVQPDDGRAVTEIFTYEPLITGPVVRKFVLDILSDYYKEPLTYEPTFDKQVIRERVVECIPEMTPRLQELVRDFRTNPEEYFPRTPVEAMVFRTASGQLVGMTRIKRPRRIAEKGARRISDRLIGLIRGVGKYLAGQRAERMGVPLDFLTSSEEEMELEFMTAERLVARQFQAETFTLRPEEVQIDDVLGVKFVGTPQVLEGIERTIAKHPRVTMVEREEHRGRYNAVNLQLDIQLPSVSECTELIKNIDWRFGEARGIPLDDLKNNFSQYVELGAPKVRIEVILTTYPEMVESELGRSLHERRILRIRDSQEYKGRISKNASHLIEYLLSLAYSPRLEIDCLPIKLWGHYLPETVEYAIAELHGIGPAGLMFHHYLPEWSDSRCVRFTPKEGTAENQGTTGYHAGGSFARTLPIPR